jgi:glycosyltransferase involved in cell wall biosynthesis
MRILYVSQYYPPEMGAPAARVSELAREWCRLGEQVTVLTAFANHPLGVKRKADRWRLTRREETDGVDVVRAYVYAAPNRGLVRRMLSYASFMVSAVAVGALRVRKPDVVIGTSPQLLCAVAAYVLARLKRARFVFEVRDLWPESILAVEAMEQNLIVRLLRRCARYLYEHCDQIVTVGDGYRQAIHRRYGVPLDRMVVIPNGIDEERFRPLPRQGALRRERGWGERFVAMYVGTLGMAHGLSVVLKAAAKLRYDASILFVLAGEGAEKTSLQEIARSEGLANVQFIDQQPRDAVPQLYAACDIGLVMLRDTPLFQEVLPSKMFEFLAMERPILLGVKGHARAIGEASGAASFVPPEDPEALAAAVTEAAGDRARLAEMGRAGRRFVLRQYNRKHQARSYLRLLEETAAAAREEVA